jgi:hypothetical protein
VEILFNLKKEKKMILEMLLIMSNIFAGLLFAGTVVGFCIQEDTSQKNKKKSTLDNFLIISLFLGFLFIFYKAHTLNSVNFLSSMFPFFLIILFFMGLILFFARAGFRDNENPAIYVLIILGVHFFCWAFLSILIEHEDIYIQQRCHDRIIIRSSQLYLFMLTSYAYLIFLACVEKIIKKVHGN